MRAPVRAATAVVLLTALAGASPLLADPITFDDVPTNVSSTVLVDGAVFRSYGAIPSIAVIAGEQNCIRCAANGTPYLAALGSPPVGILMTTESGQPFSLYEFDAAESFAGLPERWARRIDVIGQLAGGGMISTSFVLDRILDGVGGADDFQRFMLPAMFTMLSSVLFVGAGNTAVSDGLVFQDFAIDNIVTDLPAPIPEPATIGLLMTGLAIVRRRLLKARAAIHQA